MTEAAQWADSVKKKKKSMWYKKINSVYFEEKLDA